MALLHQWVAACGPKSWKDQNADSVLNAIPRYMQLHSIITVHRYIAWSRTWQLRPDSTPTANEGGGVPAGVPVLFAQQPNFWSHARAVSLLFGVLATWHTLRRRRDRHSSFHLESSRFETIRCWAYITSAMNCSLFWFRNRSYVSRNYDSSVLHTECAPLMYFETVARCRFCSLGEFYVSLVAHKSAQSQTYLHI